MLITMTRSGNANQTTRLNLVKENLAKLKIKLLSNETFYGNMSAIEASTSGVL